MVTAYLLLQSTLQVWAGGVPARRRTRWCKGHRPWEQRACRWWWLSGRQGWRSSFTGPCGQWHWCRLLHALKQPDW